MIVFALDYPELGPAEETVARLHDHVAMFKVGLELFVKEGPKAALAVPRVFLDLKLHDIPETVDRAVASACALGARVLTIHASGGPAMVAAAVKRASREATGLRIAAVTVLTSLDDRDLAAVGLSGPVDSAAVRLATLAYNEGCRDFVCSPREIRTIKQAAPGATLFTPGVRPTSHAQGDQKRVMTPADAVREGADYLVIGRPIRDAEDPREAARAIAEEIARAKATQAEARPA